MEGIIAPSPYMSAEKAISITVLEELYKVLTE
jgi:hypothetical protein